MIIFHGLLLLLLLQIISFIDSTKLHENDILTTK